MALKFLNNAKDNFINALFGTPTQVEGSNQSIGYGKDIDNYLNNLGEQEYIKKMLNKPVEERMSLDTIRKGVVNGLNYGIPEIVKAQKELGINTPKTGEEIYKAQLGEFNQPTTLNVGVSNAPRQGGLINDFISGFRENATQGFDVNNLAPQNKGLVNRIGEGLGTLVRFYNKPIGRFAAAAGLSMLTDEANPLGEGVKAYVGRQNNMTRDKAYRQSLINMGVDEAQVNAIPGIVSDDIFANYAKAKQLQDNAEYRNMMLKNQQIQNELMNQFRRDQLNYQKMKDIQNRAMKEREFNYRASQDAINNKFKRIGLDIRAKKQNAYDKKILGNIQSNKALVQKIDTLIKDIENPANKGATGLIVGSLAKSPRDWQKALANKGSTQGQLGVRGGISDIRSATLVDRTGTAQTATEMANLAPYLPDVTDSAKVAADKLKNMKKYILQETNLYEKNYSDGNINNNDGGWAF